MKSKSIIGMFALLLFSLIVSAQEPVSKSFFTDVAIDGTDTVAYHKQNNKEHKHTEGTDEFMVEYKGAEWLFTSQEDADLFKANPEKYSPAYNGFCANALSLGRGMKKTDGTQWQIYDDQLYLFAAKKGRKRWLKGDYKKYKVDADKAWQQILAEL